MESSPSTFEGSLFLSLFSLHLESCVDKILSTKVLALLGVMVILGCQLDYILNELQFRNGGHTCEDIFVSFELTESTSSLEH